MLPRKQIGGRYGTAAIVLLVGLLLAACSAKGKGTLAPYSPEAVDPLAAGVVNEGRATFDFDLTCGVIDGKPIVAGYFKYHDRGITTVTDDITGETRTFPAIKLKGELVIETVIVNGVEVTTDGNGCAAYEMLNNPFPESVAQFYGCYVVSDRDNDRKSASVGAKDDDDDDDDNGVGCGKYASSDDDECGDRKTDDDDEECCNRATNDDDDDECSAPDPAREGRFNLLVFDQKLDSPVPGFTGDAFTLELVAGQYTGYTRAGYLKKGDIKVRNTR